MTYVRVFPIQAHDLAFEYRGKRARLGHNTETVCDETKIKIFFSPWAVDKTNATDVRTLPTR